MATSFAGTKLNRTVLVTDFAGNHEPKNNIDHVEHTGFCLRFPKQHFQSSTSMLSSKVGGIARTTF